MQGLYGDRKSPDIAKFIPPWVSGGEQAEKGKPIVILGGSSSVGQYSKDSVPFLCERI